MRGGKGGAVAVDEVGRTFAPGDVALVRNEFGVWNRAILSVRPGGMVWEFGVADSRAPEYAQSRPLVVLDPESPDDVDRLADALTEHCGEQAALRSLLLPPKPEEPQGLGAVVEDADGDLWIRTTTDPEEHCGKPWQCGPVHKHWQIVTAVKVLSEGVTP